MSEIKPKKMVSRNVAVALGIICIILAVSLVGAFAYYVTVMNSEIVDRDNTISQLNSQIATLNNQINDLNATVNLAKSTPWVTDLTLNSFSTGWGTFAHANYAGYVSVVASSSSAFNVSVELSYSMPNGISYDRTAYIIHGDSAWFPILPSEVKVTVFNLSPYAPVTVSVTYFY
jgi:hypothetical protein